MLLVCSSEEDKVVVLDVGVDDYFSKFFGISELFVWVWVVLCCYSGGSQESLLVNFVDISVDLINCQVIWVGIDFYLIFIEFCLFLVLLVNVGKVII